MKYTVRFTNHFRKAYKKCIDKGLDISLLDSIIEKLANGEKLPPANRDHQLSGNGRKYRECHIRPDWLLVYRIDKDIITLTLADTGSHSDLFKM